MPSFAPVTLQPQRTTALAIVSMIAFSGFAALMIALHFLRPDYDPVSAFISEYAIGAYGFLFSLALLLLALGSFTLSVVLNNTLQKTRRVRWGVRLLALWSAGTTVAAIFPTDPGGLVETLNGALHGIGAMIGFISFIAAAFTLSLAFRTDIAYQSTSTIALAIAVIALVSMLAFFAAPLPFKGITERVFVGFVWLWLMVVTLHVLVRSRNWSNLSGSAAD